MRHLLVIVLAVCAVRASGQNPAASDLDTAWNLVAKGRRSEAVTLLRKSIKAAPRDADARLLLGSLLMEEGERTESIAQLTEAVRLRPNSAEAHNALGEAYKSFGDSKSARPEFERAVASDSSFAPARVNLATVLLQAGDSAAAQPHLDRAITLLGKSADAAVPLYLRAKISTEGREYKKAEADLTQAVTLAPDLAEAWSDLGEVRRILSDLPGSLAALRRAVQLKPDDAIASTRLGSELLASGDVHEAVAPLQRAVRIDPNNQTALNALQLALRKGGQTEEADHVKQRLTQVLRDRDKADQNLVAAISLNNQGSELEKKGDLRAAVEKYRAALATFPEHVGIRTNLAVALLKLGQWDEGLAQMRDALRRDPENTNLKKALDDALAQARAHGIAVDKP